jgi:hypothetical protein
MRLVLGDPAERHHRLNKFKGAHAKTIIVIALEWRAEKMLWIDERYPR